MQKTAEVFIWSGPPKGEDLGTVFLFEFDRINQVWLMQRIAAIVEFKGPAAG